MSTLRNSIRQAIRRSAGETFTLKYTITSSTITTSAQALTPTVTGGELAVRQIVLQTDATGLAGGTNFELQAYNATSGGQKGIATFVVETVAHLGANATYSLSPYQAGTNKYQFSVTGVPVVLSRGSQIMFLNTVGAGTGTGTIDIYITFERLDDGAQFASGPAVGNP